MFWHSLGVPPSLGPPQKPIFWLPQTRALVLFYYQPISNRRMFWHHLGIPPWVPPKIDPPIINLFVWLKLGRQFYFLISTDTTDKYFDIVWGCHPPGKIPKWTPKNKFLHDQTYDACVFDISRYFRGKYFDRVWGYPPEEPQMDPLKINFFNGFC